MMTRDELLAAHCKPLDGLGAKGALSAAAVQAQLQAVPQWQAEGGFIVRSYGFADYYDTLAFVNALAYVVHAQDHHPELVVGYNRCTVKFNTHSVGGISLNDFICAARADALYAERPGA